MKLKNIPNILSVIRILLVFVFVFCYFVMAQPFVALGVFLFAGLTDVVDGYLARRNNWVTKLGKILDPFADKLMQFTVLVCLLIDRIIPWWFVALFFIKDGFSLLAGVIVIKRRDVAVVSKWYGKLTVCIFYATIALSMIFETFLRTHKLYAVILYIPAAVSAIAALIAYIKDYAWLKNAEHKHGDIIDIRKK